MIYNDLQIYRSTDLQIYKPIYKSTDLSVARKSHHISIRLGMRTSNLEG